MIAAVDEMLIIQKSPSFRMKSVFPFNIIWYDRDGIQHINLEFAVSKVHQDLYRPKVNPAQRTFLLGTNVADYFTGAEEIVKSHNDKTIMKDDHLLTVLENTARSINEVYDFKEIVEFQPVALPFKVEKTFYWEIVRVDYYDKRLRSSYQDQDQYHCKRVAYLVEADKPRNDVDAGTMRLVAAQSMPQAPTYNANATLRVYLAQQRVVQKTQQVADQWAAAQQATQMQSQQIAAQQAADQWEMAHQAAQIAAHQENWLVMQEKEKLAQQQAAQKAGLQMAELTAQKAALLAYQQVHAKTKEEAAQLFIQQKYLAQKMQEAQQQLLESSQKLAEQQLVATLAMEIQLAEQHAA
jgi:hypothetical protein